MRLYTVHLRRHGLDPDRDLVLVREGFAWLAFVFTAFWAFAHRLWVVGAAVLAVELALAMGLNAVRADPLTQAAVSLAIAAIVGFFGNDWIRARLARQGFVETDVVAAPGPEPALQRFLDSRPAAAEGLLT